MGVPDQDFVSRKKSSHNAINHTILFLGNPVISQGTTVQAGQDLFCEQTLKDTHGFFLTVEILQYRTSIWAWLFFAPFAPGLQATWKHIQPHSLLPLQIKFGAYLLVIKDSPLVHSFWRILENFRKEWPLPCLVVIFTTLLSIGHVGPTIYGTLPIYQSLEECSPEIFSVITSNPTLWVRQQQRSFHKKPLEAIFSMCLFKAHPPAALLENTAILGD